MMMAFMPARNDVIETAARSLVHIADSHQGKTITLPIFYPSGTAVSIEVVNAGDHFVVTDDGLAYRELELVGAERLFKRNAEVVATQFGVTAGRRSLYHVASIEQLVGSMADVGAASAQIVYRIFERLAQRHDTAIAERLYGRLVDLFGENHVLADATISGASNHKWSVSALVHVDGKQIAFEAVSNHHSSVYSSATMFHDIALLEKKPTPIAVVENKSAMGEYIGILSQAANVIEADAPDSVLVKLAA